MITKKLKYSARLWWFVPATLAAGVINGLLGAGGGVIMLYVVRAVLKGRGDMEAVQKDTFATVVAIILPVSVVSAISYASKGNLNMDIMGVLTIPALIGGIIGAYLTDKLPSRVVRGIFALLVIISGVRMIF
ncbi:MAG: sulfite exporter TauE/SafE family protein [Ruminococcaceae bacterium]|nr:sulfite exporter TauE/SafE family protein [Oscillospiraceae bacterium]